MPKRVVELAGIIYRATIDVGFLLAKMGIVPSKLLNINFQEIVINRDKLLAGVMSASIQDAGQLGETISTIRFALSDVSDLLQRQMQNLLDIPRQRRKSLRIARCRAAGS